MFETLANIFGGLKSVNVDMEKANLHLNEEGVSLKFKNKNKNKEIEEKEQPKQLKEGK